MEKCETISEQTKDKDQLKILTIEYNKTIKHLKDLATKGKRLLVLMQICSKYETQREKIILFAGHTKLENSSPLSDHTIPDWDISRQVNFITYKSMRDRSIEFLRNI